MRSRSTWIYVLVGALLVLSPSARAVVIDFESVGGDSCLTLLGMQFATDGFVFTDPLAGSSFFTCNGANDPRPYSTNGTRNLLTRDAVIAEASGLPFAFRSFAAAEEIAAIVGATHIEIIGTRVDGSEASIEFRLDGFADGPGGQPDFETFLLPAAFANLTQVELRGMTERLSDNFFVDDLDLVPIPEPDTATLLLVGLMSFGAGRRRGSDRPFWRGTPRSARNAGWVGL